MREFNQLFLLLSKMSNQLHSTTIRVESGLFKYTTVRVTGSPANVKHAVAIVKQVEREERRPPAPGQVRSAYGSVLNGANKERDSY